MLAQDYPNIEYIIMDGGSTDGTPAILDRYRDRIARIHSAPDFGQGQAINCGFIGRQPAISSLFNADDTYLPGAAFRSRARI